MGGFVRKVLAPPPPPAPLPQVVEARQETVTPDKVVKVGATEQEGRLKKVRTGAGRSGRVSSSVLGSAPTTSKTLLGS